MSVRSSLLFLIFNFGLICCANLSSAINPSENRQNQQVVRRKHTNSRPSLQTDSFSKLKNILRPKIHEPQHSSRREPIPDTQCNFETDCSWNWKTNDSSGFFISTGESNIQGLKSDADNNSTGHFLLLSLKPNTTEVHVTSALLGPSPPNCRLQLWIFQKDMIGGMIKIIAETAVNHTKWILSELHGDDTKTWIRYDRTIGRKTNNFTVILEVVPSRRSEKSAVVAFDNIKLLDCFPESSNNFNSCTTSQYRCLRTNLCISTSRICDIHQDCEFGDDESQNCDKIPYGARCNFEQDSCGWYTTNGGVLQWTRHNGTTPSDKTGPSYDHTYGNATGKYMYVKTVGNPKGSGFGSSATLNSIIFNPPPRVHGNLSSGYYNSCTIRFYLHQSGNFKNGIMLLVTEITPEKNVTYDYLLWSYTDLGNKWMRKTVVLRNITHKYYLQFNAMKGTGYRTNIAIDDFSMSPECFGLNIPQSELNGYNYWNSNIEDPSSALPHKDFANEPYYKFTSCGVTGRYGPGQDNCSKFYKNTSVNVRVKTRGIQTWMAPAEGYYTFIVLGASGGKGSNGMGSSRGAMVRIVTELQKWQEVLILVGQEGTDGEAGGGGGGSFVVIYNQTRYLTPLAIAAGGGGLDSGPFVDTGSQHGQAISTSRRPMTNKISAGAGGGWAVSQRLMGLSLLKDLLDGKACYQSSKERGDGGFGGGGGGCTAGGGGGGYSGGEREEGGYSFLDLNRTLPTFSTAWSGYHAGPGSVVVIPAVRGCGCSYRCLALNVKRSQVTCICPNDKALDVDGKRCIPQEPPDTHHPDWVVVLYCFMFLAVIIAFGFVCFMLYTRYQYRAVRMTDYNLNYEFGGVIYSVKDLKEIPRNQVILEKVIGQGQFGEVYRGSYVQHSEGATKKPVAVKMLLSKSNQDTEVDFLMEALVMSQFDHPNIVNFIGVCFDKNSQYIILELLAGGDLKKFLRESRPKPNKSSLLTMRDLVMIAIDVAKGCLHMESKRFVHRDIAARNCLLTTEGPGRVTKIADFGMSRDIYISDYYRKGGKGMLPVKWMPPEAFLDGIFLSETDVWSFGILLWEIMSMGFVPYTGYTNTQVMKLVASGGRLKPPPNCPDSIYDIMTQCWHAIPTQRPKFSSILKKLDYCLQDLKVMSSPLPIFTGPPSQDSDQTITKPEIDSLKSDYLISNYTTIMADRNGIGFTSALTKLTRSKSRDIKEDEEINKLFLSSQVTNHLPKRKHDVVSLKPGISLDALAFVNQSYANNVNLKDKFARNGFIQNGSWSLPKENRF